jgi:hypothetical protein
MTYPHKLALGSPGLRQSARLRQLRHRRSLPRQDRPQPVDDILHGERRQQHAEQARQQHVAGGAERAVDPRGEQEDDDAYCRDCGDHGDQDCKIDRPQRGLTRQQRGRGDGARPCQQGSGEGECRRRGRL